jgi:HSP20 family protein
MPFAGGSERGGLQMASMHRWDPITDLAASWQRDIERMFRGLGESFGGIRGSSGSMAEWMPAADILTRGDDLVIRFELPGIDPEKDVEITVEDGMLHVRGERQETQEEKGEGYIRRETTYGAFERSVPLPGGARTEDLKATYTDGFLEIVVPGGAKRPTQRVPVEVAAEKKGGHDTQKQ